MGEKAHSPMLPLPKHQRARRLQPRHLYTVSGQNNSRHAQGSAACGFACSPSSTVSCTASTDTGSAMPSGLGHPPSALPRQGVAELAKLRACNRVRHVGQARVEEQGPVPAARPAWAGCRSGPPPPPWWPAPPCQSCPSPAPARRTAPLAGCRCRPPAPAPTAHRRPLSSKPAQHL